MERLNVSAEGEIFALQFADQAGTTTALAVWNATGGCVAHNGSVSLPIHSAAQCFSLLSILGESVGRVCRTGPAGEVVAEGVSDEVMYLWPAL